MVRSIHGMLQRPSIFLRLLLLLAVVLLGGLGLAVWQGHAWSQGRMVSAEGRRAQAAATALAVAVDPAFHDAVAAAPAQDAFRRWKRAPPALVALQVQLASSGRALGLARPSATLRLRDPFRAVVEAAPDQVHPEAMEVLVTGTDRPTWRHVAPYEPGMRQALFEGRAGHSAVIPGAEGPRVSGYAPLLDAEGSVVAVLAVHAPVALAVAEVRSQTRCQLVLAVVVLLGVLIAVGSVGQRLSRSLRHLGGAATRLSEGDLNTPVDTSVAFGTGTLAQRLEEARVLLRRRLQRLGTSQVQLAQRLIEAEAGLGPEDRQRRTWLAANSERVALTLGAGKVDGHPARLIDLSARGLVAQVLMNCPVDLPRGTMMAVRLRLEGRVEPLVVRGLVKGRELIEDEVELRLAVDFATVLEGLPPAVRRALSPRQARRVSPAPVQGVQLAVRGRADAAAVQGVVLDLSVHGAGVRVEVPEARVASWGRVVRVGVAHSGAADMVSSYAEIVRVQATAQGVVLGLNFLESDGAFEASLGALVEEAERLALIRAVG